jgi:hypothetical protein
VIISGRLEGHQSGHFACARKIKRVMEHNTCFTGITRLSLQLLTKKTKHFSKDFILEFKQNHTYNFFFLLFSTLRE